MTMTAREREAEYSNELGRCESDGEIVPVDELYEVNKTLVCERHYSDPWNN